MTFVHRRFKKRGPDPAAEFRFRDARRVCIDVQRRSFSRFSWEPRCQARFANRVEEATVAKQADPSSSLFTSRADSVNAAVLLPLLCRREIKGRETVDRVEARPCERMNHGSQIMRTAWPRRAQDGTSRVAEFAAKFRDANVNVGASRSRTDFLGAATNSPVAAGSRVPAAKLFRKP